MKSHTYTKPFLGIFILLVILIVGYFFTASKSDIPVNTTHYENKDAGVSFYYPKSLTETTKIEGELVRLTPRVADLSQQDPSDTITFFKPVTFAKADDLKKIMIETVVFDGSGNHPDSLDSFGQADIGGQRFYFIQSGRFEGILTYDYFLVKDDRVLPIFVRWYIGELWTDPTFEIKFDDRYKQLIKILGTVQVVQK